MLRGILNKSRRQHPTKQQLYGHLLLNTKTIQVRRTRHAGHCWRCSDILLWTPLHERAKAGRPARTYIQKLCADTGCSLEDLQGAINNREGWRERLKEIRAGGMIYKAKSRNITVNWVYQQPTNDTLQNGKRWLQKNSDVAAGHRVLNFSKIYWLIQEPNNTKLPLGCTVEQWVTNSLYNNKRCHQNKIHLAISYIFLKINRRGGFKYKRVCYWHVVTTLPSTLLLTPQMP